MSSQTLLMMNEMTYSSYSENKNGQNNKNTRSQTTRIQDVH